MTSPSPTQSQEAESRKYSSITVCIVPLQDGTLALYSAVGAKRSLLSVHENADDLLAAYLAITEQRFVNAQAMEEKLARQYYARQSAAPRPSLASSDLTSLASQLKL